jgi:hypothetical protein
VSLLYKCERFDVSELCDPPRPFTGRAVVFSAEEQAIQVNTVKWVVIRTEDGGACPPKRRLTFGRLEGVISQKLELSFWLLFLSYNFSLLPPFLLYLFFPSSPSLITLSFQFLLDITQLYVRGLRGALLARTIIRIYPVRRGGRN